MCSSLTRPSPPSPGILRGSLSTPFLFPNNTHTHTKLTQTGKRCIHLQPAQQPGKLDATLIAFRCPCLVLIDETHINYLSAGRHAGVMILIATDAFQGERRIEREKGSKETKLGRKCSEDTDQIFCHTDPCSCSTAPPKSVLHPALIWPRSGLCVAWLQQLFQECGVIHGGLLYREGPD